MQNPGLTLLRYSLIVAALYLLFVALFSSTVADYDLWGYLAFGRVFWEEGYFPFRDVFSYTPTKSIWVYHEWLTGVLFYPIYKYSGPVGLQFLRYLTILLTIFTVYLTAVYRGAKPVWGLIVIVPTALLISFGYVPVRAQIFTYLFFTLSLFIVERVKQRQQWPLLWWLIPIHILWANFHGGFLAGPGLVFLYGLGERISKRKSLPYFLFGTAALLSTLVNPYGIRYWYFMTEAVLMPRPDIGEWLSLFAAMQKGIYGVPLWIFIVSVFIVSLSYIFRSGQDYTEYLVLAAILFLGVRHIRHTVFFGLAFGAYLPVVLDEYGSVLSVRRIVPDALLKKLPAALAVIVFASVYLFANPSLSCLASPAFALTTPSPQFPTGAYKWIKERHFQGNILPSFEWGEFLIWYFYPFCRVAIDGRYETIYPQDISREYFDFLSGKESGRLYLKKYPHDLVLIRPDSGAHILMRTETDWKKVYFDAGCVLYLRSGDRGDRDRSS